MVRVENRVEDICGVSREEIVNAYYYLGISRKDIDELYGQIGISKKFKLTDKGEIIFKQTSDLDEICTMTGVRKSVVEYAWSKFNGDMSYEELYDLYINRDYTLDEIATKFGVTKQNIHKMVKRYGIIKDKNTCGCVIKENIDLILNLVTNGKTYKEISESLGVSESKLGKYVDSIIELSKDKEEIMEMYSDGKSLHTIALTLGLTDYRVKKRLQGWKVL